MNPTLRLALACSCLSIATPMAMAQSYRVVDLGLLPGYTTSTVPFGINAHGDVVGWAAQSAQTTAFVYTDAAGLRAVPGVSPTASLARGIDDSGTNVGRDGQFAFRYAPAGGVQSLGAIAGAMSEAWGVNAAGEVCGTSTGTGFGSEPFRWTAGTGMTALTPGIGGRAQSINASGQIAGWAGSSAFLYTPGTGVQYLAVPLSLGYGMAVNAAGHVAGITKSASGSNVHAFLPVPGQPPQDLGFVGSSPDGEVWGINANDAIVGKSTQPFAHAFLWTLQGGLQDLDAIVASPTWRLSAAYGINDAGQIIALGRSSTGASHALRLDPIAPAASTVLGSGCGAPPPSLTAAPPRLGQVLLLQLAYARPGAVGILAASLGIGMRQPLGACEIWIDPATAMVLAAVATDAQGSWTLAAPVPNDNALAGFTATAQVALAAGSGVLGLDLSNGLQSTLGR